MTTIVFDIETIPQNFEKLDESVQKYLLKSAESEEERDEIKGQMALWAPTCEIVAIGMLAVETEKGAMYFSADAKALADKQSYKLEDFEEGGIKYSAGTEKECLEKFWKAVAYADKFVTFNGRGFDCPTLLLRSAMLKVKPSKNLMPYRYSADSHVDLLEQLTFYNSMRKFNLDSYCHAFGIKSPKSDGMTGLDVFPMFKAGEYIKIARYCAGDLAATRELYLRWVEFMNIENNRSFQYRTKV